MSTIGDSLREAFFMFWETLWALILGFALSAVVQAVVRKARSPCTTRVVHDDGAE